MIQVNKENEVRKITPGAIVRGVLYIVGLINLALAFKGYNLIPVNEEAISNFITTLYLGVVWAWGYWKNNDITKKARFK